MGTYIVRHIETKEFAGIVWGTLYECWIAIDQMADPCEFEYARVPCGALLDHTPVGEGRKVTSREDGVRWVNPLVTRKLQGDESLYEALFVADRLRWRAFDFTDRGHGMIAQVRRDLAGRLPSGEAGKAE